MNVLFDLIPTQPFGTSAYHGGAEYAKALFEQVLKGKRHERVSALFDWNRPIDPAILDLAESFCTAVHRIHTIDEVTSLIKDDNASIFYSALPMKYRAMRLEEVSFIFTIHDLRPIELPTDETEKHYGKGLRYRLACLLARSRRERLSLLNKERIRSLFGVSKRYRTIAVSNHTLFSLLTEFPELDPGSIEMLYPPPIPQSADDDSILAELSLRDDEYFLILGADRWKKNAYRATLAFHEIYDDFPGFNKKFLVLGANADLPFVSRSNASGRILYTGYVSRSRLESLYKHCFCLVFPSLNEGFGYPPLECMKYGKPVLASGTGDIPEILGEAAAYFGPRSIREMKNRVIQVFHDADFRRGLGASGKRRSDEMSLKQRKASERLGDIVLGRA